jgi:SsrA-binding protein
MGRGRERLFVHPPERAGKKIRPTAHPAPSRGEARRSVLGARCRVSYDPLVPKPRAPSTAKKELERLIVARHPRARFEYDIIETFEAGIVLRGSEVKALRAGKAQVQEAYAKFRGRELFLVRSHIPEYVHGGSANHEPAQARKLLLHAHELAKIRARVTQKGLTLVPLTLYFNERGRAKLELALARGRKTHDKRDAIRTKEARHQIRRASRGR